jgi:hypothetical protein
MTAWNLLAEGGKMQISPSQGEGNKPALRQHIHCCRRQDTVLEGEPPKRVVLHVWNSMEEVKRRWDSKASKDLREVGARYGKFRVFAIEGLEQ